MPHLLPTCRYMSVGAHGGQVVCDRATAAKVLQSWGVNMLQQQEQPSSPAAGGADDHAGGPAGWRPASPALPVLELSDTCRSCSALRSSLGGGSCGSSGSLLLNRSLQDVEAALVKEQVPCSPQARSLFYCASVPKIADAVEVHHLGSFRFKGFPESVELVQVRAWRSHACCCMGLSWTHVLACLAYLACHGTTKCMKR
jgi:hypothetical protein